MKYIPFIIASLFLIGCECKAFTLDVNIPLKVERDSIAIEYVPSGIFYVGYFNGKLLRFTEDQYREAVAKGAEFRSDAITPPNVWKGEVVMNGYSYDHAPGDRIIIEDDEDNYRLRLIKSPQISLIQPVSQEYDLGSTLNIVFTPDYNYDFLGEIEVMINGEVEAYLGSRPYQMQWTPTTAGGYVIYGIFYDESGMMKETNPSTVTIINTAPPIIIEPVLLATGTELLAGDSASFSVEVSDKALVETVGFAVNEMITLSSADPYVLDYIFDVVGVYTISAWVVATDGGLFETGNVTVNVAELPPEPTYELPSPVQELKIEHLTTDGILVKVVGDNSNRGEGLDKLFDGSASTKWLQFLGGQYQTTFDILWPEDKTLSGIVLTSANDAASRDPVRARVINGRTGDEFEIDLFPLNYPRKRELEINFPSPVETDLIRIEMSTNNYGHSMQMSELSFVYQ